MLRFIPFDLTFVFGLILLPATVIIATREACVRIPGELLGYVVSFIGFLIWILLSYFWVPSTGTGFAIVKLFRVFAGLAIILFCTTLLIGLDIERINRFIRFLVITGVFFATAFLITDVGLPFQAPNRITISRPIGVATVVLWVKILWGDTSYGTLVRGLGLLACLYSLLLSGARMPFLSTIFCILFASFYYMVGEDVNIMKTRATVYSIISLAIIIPIFSLSFGSLSNAATLDRLLLLTERIGPSVAQRFLFWEVAFTEWLSHFSSILIGYGIGSFPYLLPGVTYPHNIFLEAAVELGLVGIVLLVLVIFLPLRGVLSTDSYNMQQKVTVLMLVLYMLLNSQVTGNFYINRYLFAFLPLLPVASKTAVQTD